MTSLSRATAQSVYALVRAHERRARAHRNLEHAEAELRVAEQALQKALTERRALRLVQSGGGY